MAWLTANEFRVKYVTESATETTPEQIGDCLDEAIDEIAKLCGESAVGEIDSATDDTPRKNRAFRRAQGKLAYRALLLIQSSRYRDGGIKTKERDADGGTTEEYESFDKTEMRRKVLYNEAISAIDVYLTPAATAEENDYPQIMSFSKKKIITW